jgi:hypothetical protein
MNDMMSVLKTYKGEPVAILCCRYWYRGIVADVGDNVVTLTNPRAVEITGVSTGARPSREDPIPSDIHVALASVELVCQPTWCFADYNVGG